jgi:hypothetical protein
MVAIAVDVLFPREKWVQDQTSRGSSEAVSGLRWENPVVIELYVRR